MVRTPSTISSGLGLTVALAGLFAGSIHAQQLPGSIRGRVTDSDLEVAIGGVRVQILELELTTTTSADGSYQFRQVQPGRYTFVFSRDGFISEVFSGSSAPVISPGGFVDFDVSLSGDFTDLDEFFVEDQVGPDANNEAALIDLRLNSPRLLDSISSELISRAGASDADQALRLVSGATTTEDGFAVVRGLPDRFVSSQLNARRLPSADDETRAVALDQFPSTVIQSVQVSKTFTPDQQGDASGGAVNIVLKGIPDRDLFVQSSLQLGYNAQVANRSDFLTYDGGGVSFFGQDDGRRDPQLENLGGNFDGAIGTTTDQAPIDFKYTAAAGGNYEFESGLRIGGYATWFYERDSSYIDDARDESWWVTLPGEAPTPQLFQQNGADEFLTQILDVTQARQEVQWGSLAAFGLEYEGQKVNVNYLYSRTTSDTATRAEDTRGKSFFFPGYDPNDPSTPGHAEPLTAPYLRLQTLAYEEQTTTSLQLRGEHEIPTGDFGPFERPVFEWAAAYSTAESDEPDRRQFGSQWEPDQVDANGNITRPAQYSFFRPAQQVTLGNVQRIFERTAEESEQYEFKLRFPFQQWTDTEGSFQVGYFRDLVDRSFDQNTISNFSDPNDRYQAQFDQLWSDVFPFENHTLTASAADVDYSGVFDIKATYLMLDIPIYEDLKFVTGVRFESTEIGIVNVPEPQAFLFVNNTISEFPPGAADVQFSQDDVLPAASLEFRPSDELTLRLAYSQTLARQTFRELTPIIQQQFLGGPVFIGNPDLQQAEVTNYDLRVDYTPFAGGLLSASWFLKDLKNPIEAVQQIGVINFTTVENFPEGELSGVEFEARQDFGVFSDALEGLTIGTNATFLESQVTLSEFQQTQLNLPNILAPQETRRATNAPDFLYNLFLTYDLAETGTAIGLFYTVTGDTLIAGAGVDDGNFVPDIYAEEFDNLNLTVTQRLGQNFQFRFRARNLTDPRIDQVYRSNYLGPDVLRSSTQRGIDYSFSISADFTF